MKKMKKHKIQKRKKIKKLIDKITFVKMIDKNNCSELFCFSLKLKFN